MKKLLSFTLLFLLLFNFVPCFADTKSYEIDKVDINAAIMDNGDINVTEYLTYNFSGDFNGFLRELNSTGSDGCIINSVVVIDKSGFETIATSGNTGAENTYEISENGYKTSIKLYSKSSNEKKIFKVNYTAKNVAKKYETTGQLYWDFYSVENISSIKEANLNISFYNQILTAENSRYQTFGDGELLTSYINNGININYKNLSSRIGIDLTIPAEFLVNSSIISGNDSIKGNPEPNNKDIVSENNSKNPNYGGIIFILIVGGIIALIVILVVSENKKRNEAIKKYRNEYNFISNIQYIEPPSRISPALVNLLIGKKNISQEILSSTLFYLCNLGYYNIEQLKYTEKGFLSNKADNDLVFKRNINKTLPKEAHLNFIIKWFSIYEIDNEFSLINIQNLLKKESKAKIFLKKLNEWKVKVGEDAKLQGFFTIIGNRETLTNEFYNEKLKWLSYKGFIENTINLKERLNEFNTADTILLYARALGINNASIEHYINELIITAKRASERDMDSLNYINRTYYFNYYLIHMNTMNSIYNNATPNNHDSGGGFTGGSSGGDFGGGGGGGSGAF